MLNPYNVCLTDDTTYIVLSTTKITYNFDNQVGIHHIPTTPDERGTTTPEDKTYLINLLKIKKMFTIRGGLSQGKFEYASGSDETHTAAKDKRDALKTLLEGGSTLKLIVDGVTYSGALAKLEISEEPQDMGTPNDSVEVYSVMLSFLIGQDKLAD